MSKRDRNSITVTWHEDQWRAFMYVPADDVKGWKGVFGGMTEEGPWMEGFGETPSLAIQDLFRRAGGNLVSCWLVQERLT